MREKYETLSLATLKELAKGRGMRGISTLKKGELIEAMLRQDEKDAANKDAATPSVTRRKGDGGARKKAVPSEQEKAKADAGTVPEAGKAETAGTSKRYRATRRHRNGSLSGETHNIRTSGNRTWNNPARRMNATPRPENAPERGRRNGMQQGRTYVARTQQNADSSEQPRVGRVTAELYRAQQLCRDRQYAPGFCDGRK